MRKKRIARLQAFGRTLREHLRKAAYREEKPAEAAQAVADGARHLFKRLIQPKESYKRKKAIQYVREGVEAYNIRSYDRAEQHFTRATVEDESCALAWTYLGNTHYKLGHLTEAITAWQRAVDAEPRSKGAEMAREKLSRAGKGSGSIIDNVKEQMRIR